MELSGRTQDYIRCAVRRYGPLIIVIPHRTCQPEQMVAVRLSTARSIEFQRQFDGPTQARLYVAAEYASLEYIPVLCAAASDIHYIEGAAELDLNVSGLFIL